MKNKREERTCNFYIYAKVVLLTKANINFVKRGEKILVVFNDRNNKKPKTHGFHRLSYTSIYVNKKDNRLICISQSHSWIILIKEFSPKHPHAVYDSN